ncbi:MAG: hypothetical protein JST16_04550, partial [Bdellovibrionales bacterium]|nr:hypothetical protein [Bdellovibrionales bacterium]
MMASISCSAAVRRWLFVAGIAAVGVTSFKNARAMDEAEEAAFLTACGWVDAPRGEPFGKVNGELTVRPRWNWDTESRLQKIEFDSGRYAQAAYTNPQCESYGLKRLAKRYSAQAAKQRCQDIRDTLNKDAQSTGSTGLASLSDPTRERADDDSGDICDDPSSEASYGCAYLDYNQMLGNVNKQRQVAGQIKNYCESIGADMTPRMPVDQYRSQMNSGSDSSGGGFCGNRGGIVLIQKKTSWFDTLANMTLGLGKIAGPTAAIMY